MNYKYKYLKYKIKNDYNQIGSNNIHKINTIDKIHNYNDIYSKESNCFTIFRKQNEGGNSQIDIKDNYVLRKTKNKEIDIYNKYIDFYKQLINPHFILLLDEKECLIKDSFRYHQIIEKYDNDLSKLRGNDNYNDHIHIQLGLSLYSLLNNCMCINDRKSENIFYSLDDYTLNYKINDKYYIYKTPIFIVNGDYKDCLNIDLTKCYITTVKDIHSMIQTISDVIVKKDITLVRDDTNIYKISDISNDNPLENISINIFNKKILSKIVELLTKHSTILNEPIPSEQYWDINNKIEK